MPTQHTTPTNDYPETAGEILPMAQNQARLPVSTPEKQSIASEMPVTGAPSPLPAAMATPPLPTSLPSQVMPASNTAAAASVTPPAVADDVDLIEKEWVHRAKALVAKTKDNPHEQNKEMNKFKADYIKKRYNKEIKVTEG
jgi:hypothetical protein